MVRKMAKTVVKSAAVAGAAAAARSNGAHRIVAATDAEPGEFPDRDRDVAVLHVRLVPVHGRHGGARNVPKRTPARRRPEGDSTLRELEGPRA